MLDFTDWAAQQEIDPDDDYAYYQSLIGYRHYYEFNKQPTFYFTLHPAG